MVKEVIIKRDNLRNGSISRIRAKHYAKCSYYFIEISHDEGKSWELFNVCSGYEWVDASYRQVTRGSR